MSFIQYLKDTQGELRHVAWPTRLQTIVYTVLVAIISVVVALYLGLFDYLFTSGMARFLEVLPASPVLVQEPTPTTQLTIDATGNSTNSLQGIPQLK